MTYNKTTGPTWEERSAAMAAAEGYEWDRLSETFDADWKSAYVAEFVRFAASRGWTEQNAREWADEIKDDALISGDPDPALTACHDVVECEKEYANAC